eukprot:s530_g6.t1
MIFRKEASFFPLNQSVVMWSPTAMFTSLGRCADAPRGHTCLLRHVQARGSMAPDATLGRRGGLWAICSLLGGFTCAAPSRAKQMRSSKEVERIKLEDGSEVVKLASGVQYVDLRTGGGEVPQMGDMVLAHVKGYLMEKDDPVFINTYDDGAPLIFYLGTMPQGVTQGLEEALATMKLGSIRAVQVPSYMGYPNGLARAGVKFPLRLPIPLKEGLRYEVELLRCVADSFIDLAVSLPSGRSETISISECGTIADLKIAAQQSLGRGFLRLAKADGRLLDPADSLQLSGLQNGDRLTAVAQKPKIAATFEAFALWCVGTDRVITWGSGDSGGDSSGIQAHLKNVQQICGTYGAFAAVLAEGTVVTWGKTECGGDSSTVQDQLRNVQQITRTHEAFAAVSAEGTVVTWGSPSCGGDSSRVQDQLRNVQQICGADEAFAALLADGTVVTWGHPGYGGDSSGVQHQLRNVQQISSTLDAFAALLADGTVVTWGLRDNGGDSSNVQHQLRNVQQIYGTDGAFAAILAEGTVVTWGRPDHGGDSSRVQHQLRNVQQICGSTNGAFAAHLADGTVVTWGRPDHGGDSSRVQHQLRNVQQICGTFGAFAAILAEGTVVTWGRPDYGGDSSTVQHQLRNVQQICGTSGAFAAILAEGTVVTWGDPNQGGDSSRVQDQSQQALPDSICQLQISVGTAGPQLPAPDLNRELPIPVGTAGPQRRAPDPSPSSGGEWCRQGATPVLFGCAVPLQSAFQDAFGRDF